jgi:hypothetical protein
MNRDTERSVPGGEQSPGRDGWLVSGIDTKQDVKLSIMRGALLVAMTLGIVGFLVAWILAPF